MKTLATRLFLLIVMAPLSPAAQAQDFAGPQALHDKLEAAIVTSSDAAQVEINREHQPGGQGHPDLGIARLQLLARGAEEPDQSHAQTQSENRKAERGKEVGGTGGRI